MSGPTRDERLFVALAAALLASCALAYLAAFLHARRADGAEAAVVYRAWTKADLVDAAAVFASKYDRGRVRYLRFIDQAAVAPGRRQLHLQVQGYVQNSWSTYDVIFLASEVPGTQQALLYLDLSTLRDPDDREGLDRLVKAFDDLGLKGSGPAPFPEPYYHLVDDAPAKHEEEEAATEYDEEYVEQVQSYDKQGREYVRWDAGQGKYVPVYETVKKTRKVKTAAKKAAKKKDVRTVALGPHLNKGTAIGLAALTRTAFPIFTLYWLWANGLVEPAYHTLLGLDDSLDSVLELAVADLKTSDRVGTQARGAVLFSGVAHHNRILERTPTNLRKGKTTIQISFDFKTSVRLQDVTKDLLILKPDAKEVIWNLPNGLLGFFVADANDKRLDKADADVALDNRTKFKDRQVRTAYSCIACHLPDRGWIEVDDEVRALAARPITLVADAHDKGDRDRGRRIRQKYLDDDFNTLLQTDQAVVEAAVLSATKGPDGKGLTCPKVARVIVDAIYQYVYEDVSLAQLSRELGYPQDEVLAALQVAGQDNVLTILRAGRKVRRDQIEAGAFVQVATVLYLGNHGGK